LYSQSKWNYYINIAPIYSYRNYKLADYNKATDGFSSGKVIYDSFLERYDNEEKPILKFTINAGIEYELSERISFKTGLGYKDIGERVSNESVINKYYQNGILVSPEEPIRWDWHNSYQYLGIPFDIEYKPILREKFSFGILLGFDFDFLLSSEIMNGQGAYLSDMKSFLSNASSFATNIHGGLITNISLGDKIDLYISPQFAKYITPNVSYNAELLDLHCNINQYNYYGQLKIGIVYKKQPKNAL